MSFPSSRHSSHRHKRPSINTSQTTEYQYQDVSLAGPTLHSPSPHPDHQYQGFGSLDTSAFTQSSYSSNSNSKAQTPVGGEGAQQDYYPSAAGYFPRTDSTEEAMMMSQRDLNYGYMPSPIHNSMPSYSPGQPYAPQQLAPLPGYYADSQQPRNMSGSSRPSNQPLVDFHSFNSQERESSSLQSRKRRRTSQAQDDRRQSKLRVRRNRLPGITNLSPVENHVMGGSVDMFPIAPSSSAYVQDSVDRSHPRPSMSPSYRNDFNDVSPGPSQYVSQPYHPGYSMGPMNPASLAPPLLPGSAHGYNNGRHSPMLQAPLPPAPVVSPHVEPVVLDRREKPQCWDHGCNGREFSTFSNLLRHQREKSGSAAKSYCPHCGAEFTRTTARNGHMEHGKCKTRRTSNTNTDTSNNR